MPREVYCGVVFEDDLIDEEIELRLPTGNNLTIDDFLERLASEFREQKKGYRSVRLPTTDVVNGMHGQYFIARGLRLATQKELELRDRRRTEKITFEQQIAQEQETKERAELQRLQAKYPDISQ